MKNDDQEGEKIIKWSKNASREVQKSKLFSTYTWPFYYEVTGWISGN
jgi:hypothetical protein